MVRNIPIRILVTGSRGKSSLVRLLHAALSASGLKTFARITGVLPREIGPGGCERVIRRQSPIHIGEMGWWLAQVPADAEALVMENSAVTPDLMAYAADLLCPTLVVWTTLRPDHTELWGESHLDAARALMRGIPPGVSVAGGEELNEPTLREMLRANGNPLYLAEGALAHHDANLNLAALVFSLCVPHFDAYAACQAMLALPPDIADFRILEKKGDCLAAAFSANDRQSTELLFAETGWDERETTLLYHHRTDRAARLDDFLPWIASRSWKAVVFSRGSRPWLFSWAGSELAWNDGLTDSAAFRRWWAGRGKVFACGNVAGWPLQFLREERVA